MSRLYRGMKKQPSRKKLVLDRQTVRALATGELADAAGGLPRDSNRCSWTDCVTCQTCFPENCKYV